MRQPQALGRVDTLPDADRVSALRRVPERVSQVACDPFQKLHYGQRLIGDLGVPLEGIEGWRLFIPEDHAGHSLPGTGAGAAA